MSTKDVLEQALAAAARGEARPYEVSIPGVGTVKAEGPEDHQRALEMYAAMATKRIVIPGLPDFGAAAVPGVRALPKGPMLHGSIEQFLKDYRTTGRAAATLVETEHSLALFRDLVDDVPVETLGAPHIDAFRDALAHWPARARVLPEYKGLSARDIVAKAKGKGLPGLGVRTLEKHLDRLRVFFNSLIQRGELTKNPLSGLRLQTKAAKYEPKRRGFEAKELTVLFDPGHRAKHASDDPMNFWVPLVMLYTGARMNEVVYLDVTDLECVDGTWGIHITKHLKTPQSRRFVPLPQRLMDLGLAQYAQDIVKAGFKELFPGGSTKPKNGRGDKISRWFNRSYLRKVCGILDPETCLQSFRNTLMTAGDRCGVSEAQMNPLVGHGARSIQQRHYIDQPTLAERAARIEVLAAYFKLPTLTSYRTGQFERCLLQQVRKAHRATAVQKRAGRSTKKG